jgi:hypothetical protein
MSNNILQESGLPAPVPTRWDLEKGWHVEEGPDGLERWVKEVERVNPYSLAGKISSRGPIRGLADHKGQRWGVDYNPLKRSAPNEKGYTWSMGYNQISGRYTQGNLFPELSGSSLNRKKNAKGIPTEAADLIALAEKTEKQYSRRGIWMVENWDGDKREHLGTIVSWIIIESYAGNIESARELTMRLSSALRACTRSVSYGVHVLSPRSRGKIKDKATAFFRSCPGDRIFGTFTFIAPVDDKTGQSILNKFLVQARKKFPALQYFWVAERQKGDRNEGRGVQREPTGNIHFHMILNKRLQVGRWNALWVLAQYNSGLRGHDEFGREISLDEIQEIYRLDQKEGFCGARGKNGKKISRMQAVLNPLDLKKVTSIGRLSNYLTKYVTKQDKNEPYGCAAWHCSRRVSRMFTRQTVGPSAFAYMKSIENWGIDRSTGELWGKPMEYRPCAFAVVVMALNKAAPLRYLKRMEQVNKWVLEGFEISVLPVLDDGQYLKHYICKN